MKQWEGPYRSTRSSYRYSLTQLPLAIVAVLAVAASGRAQLAYDNTLTSSGSVLYNGGAVDIGSTTITRLVADDITVAPGYEGRAIASVSFSVFNGSPEVIYARPRVRFYDSNGASGGPGTYFFGVSLLDQQTILNPGLNVLQIHPGDYYPYSINVPASGRFWIGLTFDDEFHNLSTTADQLNRLGMALYNPPALGSSSDSFFETTAGGSFVNNDPAGAIGNLGGNPAANFYFQVTVAEVPEPSLLALFVIGLLGALRRQGIDSHGAASEH